MWEKYKINALESLRSTSNKSLNNTFRLNMRTGLINNEFCQVRDKQSLIHCVKSVQIRSFFGPYFLVFSPNTGKYGPEKTPYFGHFSRSDWSI